MPTFNGQLRSNEVLSGIFNMIISQQVFADNFTGGYSKLVSEAKVDGSLFGDTKLYYSADILESAEWGKDAATNVLELHRPASPAVQSIILDKFRQIPLTVDYYLTKRAWMDEGAFSSFTSLMLDMISQTKKVYDETTYNAFLGTAHGAATKSEVEIDVTAAVGTATGKEADVIEATTIAKGIANLLSRLQDYSREYNDYGYLRSYSPDMIKVIWNVNFINKIRKVDLPTIFHKDDLFDKFEQYTLPARYFGEAPNVGATQGNGTSVCSLIEQKIGTNHYFAGDLIKVGDTAPAGTSYNIDPDVICKVVVKLPPFMSAFQVGTTFFNPRSLTENHYLTWGHNTLEYLKNYPMITVHKD